MSKEIEKEKKNKVLKFCVRNIKVSAFFFVGDVHHAQSNNSSNWTNGKETPSMHKNLIKLNFD